MNEPVAGFIVGAVIVLLVAFTASWLLGIWLKGQRDE